MTTFIVMSYIIFVNPAILGFAGVEGLQEQGLPSTPFLTSTCLVAGVMTIIMGLYTNMAYAIAPGLGLNAVVAFTLVAQAGLSFPEAMGLVVVEGLAVLILVLVGLREAIMNAIPIELKKAIAIGIGLFIAFIGLTNSGLVVRGTGTPVDLAPFTTWPVIITIVGILITIGLRAIGIPGDLFVGIILTTVFATIVNYAADVYPESSGYARWPDDIFESPDFSLVGEFNFDAFSTLPFIAALAFAFSLFLADFFDTMGTLVGVGRQAGYVDEQGQMPEIRKPLLVDSLAAAAGGAASASSATTYIESSSGVAGRPDRLGQRRHRSALLPVHVHRAADRDGSAAGHGTRPADRRVADDQRADRGRGGGRGGRDQPCRLRGVDDRAADRTTRRQRKLAGVDFHDLALGLSGRDRDHVHAVLVLDHGRDRSGVHRLRVHPRLPGRLEHRASADVGCRDRVRDLLRDPDHAAGVQLDLSPASSRAAATSAS